VTRTIDISGMDPQRGRYGYEWGTQVLMFRALEWLRSHKDKDPKFRSYKNITGILEATNPDAKEMENFALDHAKIKEFGATGAMVQYAMLHALQRFARGEDGYFAEFKDDPERFFEFDEADAFPDGKLP
jgi:hypothetical protein